MYNFKINKIITNDGTIVEPKQINIIIGPNNSGKSQFLKDIKNTLQKNHGPIIKSIVIDKMKYSLPNSKEEFIERYSIKKNIFYTRDSQFYIRSYSGINQFNIEVGNNISNYLDTGNINIQPDWENTLDRQILNFRQQICNYEQISKDGSFPSDAIIHNKRYVEYEKNGQKVSEELEVSGDSLYSPIGESIESFINIYGNLFFNYLGTEEKLLMCKRQKKYGLQDSSTNFLSQVQFNSNLLNNLSIYTKKMFNKDVYLDRFSWGDSILFRVGNDFDFIRNSSRDDSSAEIMLKDYNLLDYEGDGIKSFITNYLALHMDDKNILLLDEPESFLHPPLAKQLGEIIARSTNENKQIFVSTHSVDLLKGILNVNKDINIIRITRDGNNNQFNLLQKDKICEIIASPLLSSSNILKGLFCEKVYICESEADEEFFQSLHDKINLSDSSFFTHGRNKQELKKISDVYNELSIPNYRIYDFDILKDKDFNHAINGAIEKDIKDKFIEIRREINKNLDANKDYYHNGGIEKIHDEGVKTKTLEMLKYLKVNNIIILKTGCLESTLEDIGIPFTQNKTKWFDNAIVFINNSTIENIRNGYIYSWVFED